MHISHFPAQNQINDLIYRGGPIAFAGQFGELVLRLFMLINVGLTDLSAFFHSAT
jgi:hypothetical protein